MPEIDDDYTNLIWPEYETFLAPLRARQYKKTDIICGNIRHFHFFGSIESIALMFYVNQIKIRF